MQERGYSAGGRGAGERVFRRAMRHSRRVRLLRVAVPSAIVLLLGGFMLSAWLDPLRLLVRLPGVDGKFVISGTKITMQAPKLSGYTRDARWYEFTAHSAAQDMTNPNVVELQDIRAKIQTEDKNTVNLTAADGTFDRKSGVLKLGRNIVLQSTGGYEVQLSEAVIDTGSGDVVSDRPVEVRMLQGKLNANRLEVVKAGEVVRFDGGVRMDLPPEAMNADGQPAVRQ
ncbi:MAG: LPS export ABC transporter periplasmic protein LptC [Alphaproteobacteria bacterium]|nr:LPS export ABC transporter periplasmic protein LptC [Alphaproteobacteria bacterium]